MNDSVSIDKHGEHKPKYELNIHLLNPNEPITLSGLKRKSSKTTEQLEEEVRFLNERIDALEKDMYTMSRQHHNSSSKLDDLDDFGLSDDDKSSSNLNESFPHRTKSGKFSSITDIAYLYAVPLVREEKGKIVSMGLPIDHNEEIEDIIEGIEATNKMINFRMDTATIDNLQNLIMIKPKVVHLSCHGDFDK
jgi:hypothetical protein